MTTFSKHFSHFSGLIGRFAALSCWILFLVSSASCSSQGKPMPDLAAEINATLDPEWSRFLSGDNVVLRFAHDPNLDQTVLVDGNGYASFLLIGPLRVAGKTLAQLTDELNGAYGPKLNAPDLTINRMLPEAATTGVVGERAIYVMGEVLVPGSQAFEGQRLTLVQAIARAGGPDKRSALLQDSGSRLGYVASFPIPEVVMGINAFTLAAQKINPKFKTKVIWANTWFDPAKEADAAKALMDQGCDIITQHTDSPAPLQAAEQRGMFAFGQASNMAAFAPKGCLTSIVDDWSGYYIGRTQAVLDGKWESTDTWFGLKEGMVALGPYSETTPAPVRAAADKVVADIKSGALHPFTGPIKDQKGAEKVAAGVKVADGDLLKMDWYVEGVQS